MKKFSTITGVKVGQLPESKQDNDVQDNSDNLRFIIDSMINSYLKIEFNGPYTTEHFQQTSKIEGRETFIDALIGLLKEKEVQQQIKVLESLKSDVRDWKAIDEKIDGLNLLLEKQTAGDTAKHKKRIEDLLKKEDPIEMAKIQASRMTDGEKAHYRYLMAKSMKDLSSMEGLLKRLKKDKVERTKTQVVKLLEEIANIFKFKADQLGYK
jgi:hypothetical protein